MLPRIASTLLAEGGSLVLPTWKFILDAVNDPAFLKLCAKLNLEKEYVSDAKKSPLYVAGDLAHAQLMQAPCTLINENQIAPILACSPGVPFIFITKRAGPPPIKKPRVEGSYKNSSASSSSSSSSTSTSSSSSYLAA